LFSQTLDSLAFSYINQYRIKNGKSGLVWSDELYKNCVKHSNNMIMNDSVYHSHGYTYSENVAYGNGFLITEGYKIFIKKYYNLSYEDIIKDFNTFCATQTIYGWYISKSHNKIMLSDGKYGAFHVEIRDLIKKNNVIFGRELFKGGGPFYYKAIVAQTFQIK
jgi:uncharacterized protein YkwD